LRFFLNKYKSIILNLTNKLGFVTLGKLLTFITVPIITRALSVENYGLYNYVVTIASYAFLLGNWGFLAKGIREISITDNKFDKENIVNDIVSARIVLWLIGSLITFIVILISSKLKLDLLFYVGLAILSNLGLALAVDFYFYGKKDTFIPSLSHFTAQVFFLIMIFFLIKDNNDLSKLLFVSFFMYMIEASILFFYYLKENQLNIKLNVSKAFILLKQNFYLGLGAKVNFFQNSIPIIIIPLFLSQFSLGIFSASFKIVSIISLVLQSSGLVFSPWIAKSKIKSIPEKKALFYKLFFGYIIVAILSSTFVFFAGKHISKLLLGNDFVDTIEIIELFALLYLPIFPVYTLLTLFINNYSKDKQYFTGSLIQLITVALLLPIFLYFWDLKGVVITLSISTFIVCLYYFEKIYSSFKIKESTEL
jgi:PST family polysaccharide transporter